MHPQEPNSIRPRRVELVDSSNQHNFCQISVMTASKRALELPSTLDNSIHVCECLPSSLQLSCGYLLASWSVNMIPRQLVSNFGIIRTLYPKGTHICIMAHGMCNAILLPN
ncbi:hypothetical protein TWF594_008002 [Orbilia oligospora]|nr:hypothetical protein TWF594_008002 [Orbilia oligospora]